MEWVFELWKQSPWSVMTVVFVSVGVVIPGIVIFISSKQKPSDPALVDTSSEPDQPVQTTLPIDFKHCIQPSQSVVLLEQESNAFEASGDKQALAVSLGNLAVAQICLGEFEEARINLNYAIKLCRDRQDDFLVAVLCLELGRLLVYQGEFEQADGEFELALNIFQTQNNLQGQGRVWTYRALAAVLEGEYFQALEVAQKSLELLVGEGASASEQRDIIQAKYLLGVASRGVNKLDEANMCLQEVLADCRSVNLVEFEPSILLELARICREQAIMKQPVEQSLHCSSGESCGCDSGHQEVADEPVDPASLEAYNLAEKALELAKQYGYRLQQTDIHLLLAQLAIDVDDESKVLYESDSAYKHASCGYKPAIEAANMYKKLMTVKTGCSCSH